MKERVSKAVVNWLLKDDEEKQKYYEIYLFGIDQMLGNIINILTAMIIGILFGELLRTIIFVTPFMVIRSYAGGYHASSTLRCYILTNIAIIVVLSAMKFITFSSTFLGCLSVMNSMVILILAPVDTENKRLDEIECIHYRKKTIIVWSVEVVITIFCAILQYKLIAESVIFAQVVLSLSLICGQIHNLHEKGK